jgi:nucleoid DNA-binding protein
MNDMATTRQGESADLSAFVERKAQLDRAAMAVESEQRALQALALQADSLALRQTGEFERATRAARAPSGRPARPWR